MIISSPLLLSANSENKEQIFERVIHQVLHDVESQEKCTWTRNVMEEMNYTFVSVWYKTQCYYGGIHITFVERFPTSVRKFRSWRRTWQSDHVVTNLVTNFATRLGTTSQTSLPFRELLDPKLWPI